MRHILKRVSSACTALFCAVALTVSGAEIAAAADETGSALKEQLAMTAESLTEAIIPLTDEEIEAYISGGDEFTENAMQSWVSSREELGELVEIKDAEVVLSGGQYTVTVPADFKTADANFVYVFSEAGVPSSMTVDVQYPMSVTLQRAAMNTVMGIGTVFLMLAFLSFIIYLFRFIPALLEGKKKEAAPAPASVPAPAPAAAPAVEDVPDDTELVAVIAAAVAAAEGTSVDGFVVRSIRKVNRKKR